MDSNAYERALSEGYEGLNSQQILDSYGIVEYSAADLVKDFDDARQYKVEQARIFKVLDAADRSDVWKVYNRKLPSYVSTPTHNPITIIKEATKASIMPTSFQGEFRPLSIDAREVADVCNKYFRMKWEAAEMDSVNNEAADYAFLLGTSGVLFGWNQNIVDHADVANYFNPAKRVQFQARAYHPSNVFPDPTATSVDEMRYLFFAERKSKAFLKTIPRFQKALRAIEAGSAPYGDPSTGRIPDSAKKDSLDTCTFITCYRRVNRITTNPMTGVPTLSPKVDIIYMAGREVLDVSPNIEPNIIPFVPLYDEKVPNDFWGVSKCYKVLSLVLTLNQIDSIEATMYFKNQNPAEFINALAGLNVPEYQRKRDNPDAAFTVNCDPKAVQAFAERPDVPKTLDSFRQYLLQEIANISGVDAAYLGKSYGSIQTTGGVEQAVDRATMRDANRIKNIDRFIRKEIEVMCQFYIAHGQPEEFYSSKDRLEHDQAGELLKFDPTALIAREDIEIDVTNAAPRSNQSLEDGAMKLMELQMKYSPSEKGYPDFITPEELINCLNLPATMKNVIKERMANQMENLKLQEYTSILMAFGQLTEAGMDPEMALTLIVHQIEQGPLGQIPATTTAPTPLGGQMPSPDGPQQ